MATMTIENEFGKKIGGSKRDQWAARGLWITDLEDMNDAELLRDVKKNNIFPTPDYQKMKEEGLDPRICYFIKLAKDALATAPRLKGREWAEAYVRDITYLRDKLLSLKTIEACEAFATNVLIGEGYIVYINSYRKTGSDKGRNVGADSMYNKIYNVTGNKLERLVSKKKFLYSDYEIFASKFMTVEKTATMSFETENGHTCLRTSCSRRYCTGLTKEVFDSIPVGEHLLLTISQEYISHGPEALINETLKKFYELHVASQNVTEEIEKKPGKKRFVPANIEHCTRTRNGRVCITKNVTPEWMLNAFHFHGGEFGNWENEATRQESLDRAYDAFHDLALVLGINPSAVAFDERLSIAFGARGRGSAAAHYEPERMVINLTKTQGGGSLAHEYGHSLDDICSKRKDPTRKAILRRSSKATALGLIPRTNAKS